MKIVIGIVLIALVIMGLAAYLVLMLNAREMIFCGDVKNDSGTATAVTRVYTTDLSANETLSEIIVKMNESQDGAVQVQDLTEVLAQYQKTADINLGTGMVIIGLASLIIGETLMPRGKTWMKALGAILGSILYRFIIAIALRLDLPSECLKLISAVIVALAIGLPAIKSAVRPATKGGKA